MVSVFLFSGFIKYAPRQADSRIDGINGFLCYPLNSAQSNYRADFVKHLTLSDAVQYCSQSVSCKMIWDKSTYFLGSQTCGFDSIVGSNYDPHFSGFSFIYEKGLNRSLL